MISDPFFPLLTQKRMPHSYSMQSMSNHIPIGPTPTPVPISEVDRLLSDMKSFECILGAIVAGITAYYFVPGASNSRMAVQIAGASYVGSVLGKFVGDKYLSSYDPFK